MTQHYPKGTVEVSEWCQRCRRKTMHKVFDGRVQSCMVCLEKPAAPAPKRQPLKGEQLDLFGKGN